MTSTLVQMFARPPVAGRVKSRLSDAIGAQRALAVYRHCLQHNLALIRASGFAYQIWLSEPGQDELFADDSLQLQQGSDLGERMYHALSSGLRANDDPSRRVMLIGSDCLDLNHAHLQRVAARLEQHELVLIPADDGGYVLIAARSHIPAALFAGIDWGSDRVLVQTLERVMQHCMRACILNPLRDIDRVADLQHYPGLQQYLE